MRRSNSPSITPPKFLPPLALDPSPTIIVAGFARGRGAPISATKTSSNSSSANNFPSTVPSFENLLKTSSYFFPVDLPLGRYALGTRGIDESREMNEGRERGERGDRNWVNQESQPCNLPFLDRLRNIDAERSDQTYPYIDHR